MKTFAIAGLVLAALAAPSLSARQQTSGTRWEYFRLTPGIPTDTTAADASGYYGCRASTPEWTCREFKGGDESLSRALASLGADRWELVAVSDDPEHQYPKGLTYVFKRRAQ